MTEFVSKACKFQEGSTQWQVLNAIEVLSSYGRYVAEEKVFDLLKMMRQASGTTPLGQVELNQILKFMTDSGVLEMSRSEMPAMNQFCGCGSCAGGSCGGGCCGCGRYYRVKIGAMH
ncbi:hypothetical protein WDU94_006965 [Cyamophila willieti]